MPESHAPPAYWAIWLPELEALTRGIAHTFSNRVGALSALIELGDAETPEGRAGLHGELKRLHAVNQLLKQLAGEPGAQPEAMTLAEIVGAALQLHASRLDVRDVPYTSAMDEQVAVRASRPMLLRLLMVVLARAARRAAERSAALEVRVSGSESEALVEIAGQGDSLLEAGQTELRSMADAVGARLEERDGAVFLALPTLQELRRRERSG